MLIRFIPLPTRNIPRYNTSLCCSSNLSETKLRCNKVKISYCPNIKVTHCNLEGVNDEKTQIY